MAARRMGFGMFRGFRGREAKDRKRDELLNPWGGNYVLGCKWQKHEDGDHWENKKRELIRGF